MNNVTDFNGNKYIAQYTANWFS